METGAEPRVLIVFQSEEGQTASVASRAAEGLRAHGMASDVFAVSEAPATLHAYAGVILGGSVHAGRHDRKLLQYAAKHVAALQAKPAAFFSVSLSAAGQDDRHQADAMRLAHEFLDAVAWQPDIVAVFGGALKYTRYGFIKRHVMRTIARHEGGETDTSRDWEYTDWEAVGEFASDFATLVKEACHAGV
jgi:menaquinone-dependent protoporphyrinogen oxidase